jgi:outer membrane receptor for ferrienterochelin and colicins
MPRDYQVRVDRLRSPWLLSACAVALLGFASTAWSQKRAAPETVEEDEEGDAGTVVVSAARSGQLVRDQPVRVEVVPDAEIEENLTVAPGNLTNVLNELAGIRMQSAAPGLGGTSLQLRGLPGRHAQILSDGLPLSGAQTDAFSLLQTPPLDLGRVEVIKGVASALYGGSALAGVLNLVSREPDDETEVVLNQTSVGGTDAVGFISSPADTPWSYTLTSAANYQSREDPDHDGWTDLPGYTRAMLRPRFFWNGGSDRTAFATLGITGEDRKGGTMPGRALPTGGAFAQELRTRRVDGGAVTRMARSNDQVVSARGSASFARRDQIFGIQRVEDTTATVFGEATIQGERNDHHWLLGAVLQYERLHTDDVAGVSYDYTVPALFVQDEFAPARWLSLAASARLDAHSDYGTFVNPRLSALFRWDDKWSLRMSAGTGFAAPTPLVEDVQARSLGVLNPITDLRAERASSISVDAKWASRPWDVNLSVFRSEIRHAIDVLPAAQPDRLNLVNSEGPLRANGAELLIGYVTGPLHVLANATLLDVTEDVEGLGREDSELVPRFSAELAGILENEELGRVGIEIAYTGRQHLSDDPYRTESHSYIEVNALAEWRIGRASLFVNALNLTNVKQSHYAPLLRPVPGIAGDPITDVWAPLPGLTVNAGVRLKLGTEEKE